MFNKLRTVIYHVPDLQAAKEWYISLTGKQPYFDEAFYVGFDFNGYELGLHPIDDTITKGNQSIAHWAVDDIDASIEKTIKLGAIILQEVADVGAGIKVAALTDPWGNAIGLIEETSQ